MNDLEAMLREALHAAPTPQPSIGDPVDAVNRRAARARAFVAVGAVAVIAAITASIVVPLGLVDRADRPSRIGPPITQPTPHRTTGSPQEWLKGGSQLVTPGDGFLWQLRRTSTSTREVEHVDKIDRITHQELGSWQLSAPADFMAYGLSRVWIWGGGDGGYPDGLLQSVDPANGNTVKLSNTHQAFNGVAFAAGRVWATTGRQVWQLDVSHGVTVVSLTQLPGDTTQLGIAATESGQLWVRVGKSWLRIDTGSHQVVDTVSWDGWMLGAAGGDAVWTDDGPRLVALSPALLHQGLSVAEGVRIQAPGPATAVSGSIQAGLFVVAYASSDLVDDKSASLYYVSPQQISSGAAIDEHTPAVAGAQPYLLAADGEGGVNYSDGDSAWRWVP